jgi:hypothetical protein
LSERLDLEVFDLHVGVDDCFVDRDLLAADI